jgi:hypothetical protein
MTLLPVVRCALLAILLVATLVAGCAGKHTTTAPYTVGNQAERPLEGKVVRINPTGRFVVLNFPIGRMPALGQRLDLFRHGVKTGEVKVNGPLWDDDAVADISTGNPELGDIVREQ